MVDGLAVGPVHPKIALLANGPEVQRGVEMNSGLPDLAAHNAWATSQVLAFCSALDETALNSSAPGTYGTIIETLQHIVDADASYVFRLTGAWPEAPWKGDSDVGIDVLVERADVLAKTLKTFLAGEWDSERIGEARGDDGDVFAVRAGVFLAQLLHHANEHRAHICTILGALEIEPPDVSAWGYASATGREWLISSRVNSE
jgi:uncharacterized damage-inducible protein DinB